jgi:hypothetical protein
MTVNDAILRALDIGPHSSTAERSIDTRSPLVEIVFDDEQPRTTSATRSE